MLDPRGGGSTSPNGPPGSTGNGTSRPSVTSSAAAAASHKASASPVNKSRGLLLVVPRMRHVSAREQRNYALEDVVS